MRKESGLRIGYNPQPDNLKNKKIKITPKPPKKEYYEKTKR